MKPGARWPFPKPGKSKTTDEPKTSKVRKTQASTKAKESAPNPTSGTAKPTNQREREKQRRQEFKAAGLCRDCREQAIPNQTRCEECAEKHRVERRKYEADRRAKLRAEKDQHKEK